MPGIVGVIAAVAEEPEVQAAVEKLVSGLFTHLKDVLAGGNAADVEQALNEGLDKSSDMAAAVVANTNASS